MTSSRCLSWVVWSSLPGIPFTVNHQPSPPIWSCCRWTLNGPGQCLQKLARCGIWSGDSKNHFVGSSVRSSQQKMQNLDIRWYKMNILLFLDRSIFGYFKSNKSRNCPSLKFDCLSVLDFDPTLDSPLSHLARVKSARKGWVMSIYVGPIYSQTVEVFLLSWGNPPMTKHIIERLWR